MKKDQLNRVKDTTNNTIYKTTNFKDYEPQILEIIKSHYCYRAHINYWGKLFTSGSIRPELIVDYSGVLAEMFGTPDKQAAILKILEKNSPTYETLNSSSELALKEIISDMDFQYNGKVEITHNALKTILRQCLTVESLQDDLTVFCDLFKIDVLGGTHTSERNYQSSSHWLEKICYLIAESYGWESSWGKDEQAWDCFMLCRDVNFKIEKELDDYIIFLSYYVKAIKRTKPSLNAA